MRSLRRDDDCGRRAAGAEEREERVGDGCDVVVRDAEGGC
jgi:hypothetical protein